MSTAARIEIARLVALEAAGVDAAKLADGIDRIFRETAARWPDDTAAAQAFKYLWLDQYLEHERELAFVAMWGASPDARDASVAGYLVGCRVNPAKSSRFAELGYFGTFSGLCRAYPAHLHVNVDASHRGRRVGEQLVEALCAMLANEGVPGVHVVTGREQRNVGFYKRLGFGELGCTPRGATEVLFLGRRLG